MPVPDRRAEGARQVPGPASSSAARWAAIQRVVDGALDRAPAARAAYLEAACGADPGLHADAARLVEACERAGQGGGFLSTPAVALAAPLLADNAADDAAQLASQRAALADAVRAALADRYVVGRELGHGGMATVYLARDLRHDRAVAVKVLARHVAAIDGERFRREIRTAARLTHPHVLGVHDSGEADGLLYFVMPYVAGETLRARLTREGALSLADAVHLLRELADALAYAHGRGVLHRDLKPENVLLSGGHAIVADFGIAKALAVASTDPGAEATAAAGGVALTQRGTAVGTPAYMAPEQAAGDPDTDHRADLYAWGMLAYEVLAGAAPFAGRPAHAALVAQVVELPPPLAARRPDAPPALRALVERCVAKDPADRPQRADEILAVLDGVIVARTAAHAAHAAAREPVTQAASRGAEMPRARPTVSAEAYDVYLRGRHFWHQRATGAPAALEHFRHAVALDPACAQAHAGLADVYLTLGTFQFMPSRTAYPLSLAAAERALALAPDAADAHASRGAIAMFFEYDYARAQHHLERALALDPGYVLAMQWLADLHLVQRRVAAMRALMARALGCEPLSATAHTHFGTLVGLAGSAAESAVLLHRATELDPSYAFVDFGRAVVAVQNGRPDDGVEAAERFVAATRGAVLALATRAALYAETGRRADAEREIAALLARGPGVSLPRAHIAHAQWALGRHEEAYEQLEAAPLDPYLSLPFIGIAAGFAPLRGAPRFEAVLRRLGLPPSR